MCPSCVQGREGRGGAVAKSKRKGVFSGMVAPSPGSAFLTFFPFPNIENIRREYVTFWSPPGRNSGVKGESAVEEVFLINVGLEEIIRADFLYP